MADGHPEQGEAAEIVCEQAVYGSFPFWHRGYDLLARSPGCRGEWLADFRAACQRFGERPARSTATGDGALFALRLPSGPWAVVGVAPQGVDDAGRPGALAFHGLFLSPRDYRRIGANPFALAGCLRTGWGPEAADLPRITCKVGPAPTASTPPDDRARRVADLLAAGRRVALESDEPIDALARAAWAALPEAARRSRSLATLAFGNGNRFDLLAAPRLAALALDASYATPDPSGRLPDPAPTPRSRPGRRLKVLAGLAALAAGVVLGLAWPAGDGRDEPEPAPPRSEPVVAPGRATPPPPPPPIEASGPGDAPEEVARAAEALAELSARFGLDDATPPPLGEPAGLMVDLARRLRYRGPRLTEDERAALAAEPDAVEGARALAWDGHVGRFAPDRPLPAGFADAPLRRQLDALAWSFHLDDWDRDEAARRTPAEVVQKLGESLAVDASTRPSPLADRYPALADYARFLSRLPRR